MCPACLSRSETVQGGGRRGEGQRGAVSPCGQRHAFYLRLPLSSASQQQQQRQSTCSVIRLLKVRVTQ